MTKKTAGTYYVWEKALELEDEFAFFSNEPEGFRAKHWISGEKIAAPPAIELVSDKNPSQDSAKKATSAKLSDVLLTGFELEVLSPKFVSLLAKTGVENIQYIPVTLVNHKTKEKETSYKIANILGAIDCLDLKNSQHSLAPGSNVVLRVTKFKIFPEKILPLPGMKEPPLIFRLGEFKRRILVHESVKEACEKAGITGIKFTKPEEYV